MEFEWDPDKAVSNVRKHRIDFETGVKVFEDVFRLEYDQPDNVDVMRYRRGRRTAACRHVHRAGRSLSDHISQIGRSS